MFKLTLGIVKNPTQYHVVPTLCVSYSLPKNPCNIGYLSYGMQTLFPICTSLIYLLAFLLLTGLYLFHLPIYHFCSKDVVIETKMSCSVFPLIFLSLSACT